MHRWLLIECFLLRSPPRMFTNSGLKTWTVIQTTGSHFHKQMIGWSAAGTFGSFRRTCRGLKLHQRDTLTPASSVVPLLVGWLVDLSCSCYSKMLTKSLNSRFTYDSFSEIELLGRSTCVFKAVGWYPVARTPPGLNVCTALGLGEEEAGSMSVDPQSVWLPSERSR